MNQWLYFSYQAKAIPGKGLRISNVHPSDAGEYICTASNAVDDVITASMKLDVSERPVITVKPQAHLQQPEGTVNQILEEKFLFNWKMCILINQKVRWFKFSDFNIQIISKF